jgi:hypothetical protein
MYRNSTAPQGIKDLLRESFKLYFSQFWQVVIFSAIAAAVSAQLSMRSLAEQNIMLMSLTQSVDWSAVLRFVLINFVIMIFVLWCYGALPEYDDWLTMVR